MNKNMKKFSIRVGLAALLAALALAFHYYDQPVNQTSSGGPSTLTTGMQVHFIDVGQGDSILITSDSHAMLIDAGENDKGEIVLDYLKKQNVKELDYMIGTHPHSDHIGGLDTVIDHIKVGEAILPKVVHNTKTYEDLLDAINKHTIPVKPAKLGEKYQLGAASFVIISPSSSSYEELNNYSVGIKLTYGDTSFVLAGDAEKLSEKEMVKSGIDLSADVLKLSHHGATNGLCEDLLDAVKPNYAVISVGADNDYGHPSPTTLKAMLKHGIKVFRTDIQGSIVFTTDGTSMKGSTKPYEITEKDLKKKAD